MLEKPSFMAICEGFVTKESMAKQTLREDSVGVGGNAMASNTCRALARKDLQALCNDWGKMRTQEYLHYMVSNFSTS